MNQISQEKPKQVLFSIINSLLDNRDEFLVNPQSDFTRSKKITFSQTILFPMIAGSYNVATELLDYFGENNPPLPSAMIQRRNQVKPEAFKELFLRFTLNIPKLQTFHGYQLVSVDGSVNHLISVYRNPGIILLSTTIAKMLNIKPSII